MIGFGGAICDLGGNTMLMWELGAGSGRAMNLLHLCFGIGALMSPLVVHVGLDLATRGGGHRCAVLAVWALRMPAPSRPPQAREEHTDTTLSILLLLFLFFFLYVGLEVGFAGWIKTYGEEIGFTELAATWLTTVFWLGFTGGRLLASAIANRVRPDMILYVACAASIVAAAVMIAGGGNDRSRVDRHGDDGARHRAPVPGDDDARRTSHPHLGIGDVVVRRRRRGGRARVPVRHRPVLRRPRCRRAARGGIRAGDGDVRGVRHRQPRPRARAVATGS